MTGWELLLYVAVLVVALAYLIRSIVEFLKSEKPLTKDELHELFHGEDQRRKFAQSLRNSNAWFPDSKNQTRPAPTSMPSSGKKTRI